MVTWLLLLLLLLLRQLPSPTAHHDGLAAQVWSQPVLRFSVSRATTAPTIGRLTGAPEVKQ